ncbi:unnamed protein product [Symbiodinium sp. CCMP2592]|nr:unnamed protein product [Symbiodinium sp. CCMP2592]
MNLLSRPATFSSLVVLAKVPARAGAKITVRLQMLSGVASGGLVLASSFTAGGYVYPGSDLFMCTGVRVQPQSALLPRGWRRAALAAPSGCSADLEPAIPVAWSESADVTGDLYYWSLTPGKNVRRDMTSTMFEDATGNHQLRLFLVTAASGSANVVWLVADEEPNVRLTSCPIALGSAMSVSYISGEFVSSDLAVIRQVPKRDNEARKSAQVGFGEECHFETAFNDLDELLRRTRKAAINVLPGSVVLITILLVNVMAAWSRVPVDQVSNFGLATVTLIVGILIAALGLKVTFYHGAFLAVSVILGSVYARLFARYRPSSTAVRALVRTRFDWQLYAVIFRAARKLGPIGLMSNVPVFLSIFLTLAIHVIGIYTFCATLLPDSFWRKFRSGEIDFSVFGPLHGGSRKLLREAMTPGEGGSEARISRILLTLMLLLFPVTLVVAALTIGFQRFGGVEYGESVSVVVPKSQAESICKLNPSGAFEWGSIRGTGAPKQEALIERLNKTFPKSLAKGESIKSYMRSLKQAVRIEELEAQAWVEVAPEVTDRTMLKRGWGATVGMLVLRSCGVAMAQAVELTEGRLWATPLHVFTKGLKDLIDGETIYVRLGSRRGETGKKKALWLRLTAKPSQPFQMAAAVGCTHRDSLVLFGVSAEEHMKWAPSGSNYRTVSYQIGDGSNEGASGTAIALSSTDGSFGFGVHRELSTSRLDRAANLDSGKRDQMQAVLVAMCDEDSEGTGVGDLTWQMEWWRNFFGLDMQTGMPGSSNDPPPPLTDADLAQLQADQDEARREQDRERRVREAEQMAQKQYEEAYHKYQEELGEDESVRLRRLTAQEYKQWEDWQWNNIMGERPPKRQRNVLAVTVSGRVDRGSAWLSRSLRVPVGAGGTASLRLDMELLTEICPDDVDTVVLEHGPVGVNPDDGNDGSADAEVSRAERGPEGIAATDVPPAGREPDAVHSAPVGEAGRSELRAPRHDVLPDELSTLPYEATQLEDGSLSGLEFVQYEQLYAAWKEGRLDDAAVRSAGGEAPLDLMQGQRLLDFEEETQVAGTTRDAENVELGQMEQTEHHDEYYGDPHEPADLTRVNPQSPYSRMLDRAFDGIRTSDEE